MKTRSVCYARRSGRSSGWQKHEIEENHGRCHEISRERTIQATAGHVKGLGFTKDIASKRVMCFNLNFQGFTLSMDWEKQEQKHSHFTTAITEVRHGASLN